MIQFSETNAKVAAAFVKAQAACDDAKKDSANPAFKRDGKVMKYADLGAVWDACGAALAANALGVVQLPGPITDGKMSMTTMLLHESGEWLQSDGEIPLPKADPQGQGSATTYFRRYALAALMGVVQEDDDGNAASQQARHAAPRHDPAPAPPPADRAASKPVDGKNVSATQLAQAFAKDLIAEFEKMTDVDSARFDKIVESNKYKNGMERLRADNADLHASVVKARDAAFERMDTVPF